MNSDGLLSISEFSRITGVSRSALIYYDDIGVFSPIKRGKNQYRYYAPQQITTVKFINVLNSLKVPLRVISRLAAQRTPDSITKVLTAEDLKASGKIAELEEYVGMFQTRLALIKEAENATVDQVEIRELEELPLIMGPLNVFERDGEYLQPFGEFCLHYQHESNLLSYPVGGFFDSFESFVDAPASPSHFFFVHPRGAQPRPAGRYLVAHTHAYYGQANNIEQRMFAFARENGLSTKGPVYNIFLLDEITNSSYENYLLQASVALE
ncbi:MAG: MerR family transcriptional regulator [Coriobacteriales bacterium]|nr:MerR family transcriptional regulator [Coriobacteriales bacterium]